MQERYIEYQLFPEDYFSGCDISVYFGDIWVDEIVSLTFSLVEQVQPIYSYNSKTYNDVARGNRIIQGTFRINFREARYLTSILKKCIERQEEIKTFTSSPKDRVSALVSLARSGEILINTREFLDEYKILNLLKKYGKFLPVPIRFGNEKKWEKPEGEEKEKEIEEAKKRGEW